MHHGDDSDLVLISSHRLHFESIQYCTERPATLGLQCARSRATELQMFPQRPFHSYAQNLEDIVLWRALHEVKQGRYIDIGACDPRVDSVSRGFYEQGWRGVHFEPVQAFAESIRHDRPDETVHEVALSDESGQLEFFVSPNEGLSTGVPSHAKPGAKPSRVPSRTLASFASELGDSPVHWMKIDVEGMEAAVIQGWDSRVLRPWVVLIEATKPNSTEQTHSEWEHMVLAAGYRFALFDGLNRFYVAEEHKNLLPLISIPANIFDFMAGCRMEAWRSYCAPQSWDSHPAAQSPLAKRRFNRGFFRDIASRLGLRARSRST